MQFFKPENLTCPLCDGKKRFHSGARAKVQCSWDCWKCKGRGTLRITFFDHLLLKFKRKLDALSYDYDRGAY
jgi:hypothetical protein